jgi:hypothetical protein
MELRTSTREATFISQLYGVNADWLCFFESMSSCTMHVS